MGNDVSNDLKKATVASYQSGKAYNTISKSFILQRDYSQVENV